MATTRTTTSRSINAVLAVEMFRAGIRDAVDQAYDHTTSASDYGPAFARGGRIGRTVAKARHLDRA